MIAWNAAGISPAVGSVLWSESVAAEVIVFLQSALFCCGALRQRLPWLWRPSRPWIVAVVPSGPGSVGSHSACHGRRRDFSETTSGGTPAIGCSVSGAIRASGRSFASFSLYGWFTEGVDTLDLKEARALLAAFGSLRSAIPSVSRPAGSKWT
jgi:hypothetical protein